MEAEILKLKNEIIELLNLDTTAEEIDTDAPLFGEGLGLDSIDALELIVLLEKNYGIKLSDNQKTREVFASIRTLAEFIKTHKS